VTVAEPPSIVEATVLLVPPVEWALPSPAEPPAFSVPPLETTDVPLVPPRLTVLVSFEEANCAFIPPVEVAPPPELCGFVSDWAPPQASK